jgi:hypothetical protein
MLTRREFGFLAVAGLVRLKPDTTYGLPPLRAERASASLAGGFGGGGKADATGELGVASSTISGVRIGVQTYSYRDLPRPAGAADSIDVVIKAMAEAGLTE